MQTGPTESNDHGVEAAHDRVGDAFGGRHLHYVGYLIGAGEQRDVSIAFRDGVERGMERAAVGRQRPSVDRDDQDLGAARFEGGHQVAIRYAVLLQGDALAAQIASRGEDIEQFTPGVRFGRFHGGLQSQLTHDGEGLGPAHDSDDARKGGGQGGARMPRFHHLEQRAHADAGQQNRDIDLAREQTVRKIERGRIVAERHLAHGRRDDRAAAVALDEPGGLGGHPAFECNHAHPREIGRRRCGCWSGTHRRLVLILPSPVRRSLRHSRGSRRRDGEVLAVFSAIRGQSAMRGKLFLAVVMCGVAFALPAFADQAPAANAVEPLKPVEPLFEGLGSLHHPVSTNSAQAQKYFDQGLALVYAFNHDEAQRSFEEAVKIDPSMAMGWWGIALTTGPNINLPEDAERGQVAYDAIQKARSLESGTNPEERALIDALAKRYAASGAMTTAQQQAYADAMRQVWKRYPNDPDVGTLFAESLMDLHPWQLWTKDGKAGPDTEEIVVTLETVMAKHPEHMGANHYYIHTVEASPHPERGLPSAERLASIAPAAGHLVHMPAHIYIRTGNYAASAEANRRAIAADKQYLQVRPEMGVYRIMYCSHNVHFLWASYLMEGSRKGATGAARQIAMAVTPDMVRQMPMAEFMLPVGIFTKARFGEWDAILVEPAPPAELKYTTGIWHYARGLAYAAKGRQADAAKEQRQLDAITTATPAEALVGQNRGRDLLMLASEILKGERAARAGDENGAVEHLRRAVAFQDALDYEEPPAWYYPVRETLGYELLAQGKTREAEAVFNDDLRHNPENGWALAGLVRCLEARNADATEARARFKKAWANADVSPYAIYLPTATAAAN